MFRVWSPSISCPHVRLLISLLFLLIIFPVVAEEVPSEVITLQNAAEQDLLNKNYEAAREKYQLLISNYPGMPYAIDAQVGVVVSYIGGNNYEQAEAQIGLIMNGSASDLEKAQALYEIARQWQSNQQPARSDALHQYNSTTFPGTQRGMWSQVELVKAAFDRKDLSAVKSQYDLLLQRFASQQTLPKEICQIGRRYAKAGLPKEALTLHRYNVSHFPDHPYGMLSKSELICDSIYKGQWDTAESEYVSFRQHTAGSSTLPEALYFIGRTYGQMGKWDKAYAIHQENAQSHGDVEHGRWSSVEVILELIRRQNFAAAQAACDAFIARYPNEPTLSKEIYRFGLEFNKAGDRQKGFTWHLYNAGHFGDTDSGRLSCEEVILYYINQEDFSKASEACLAFIQRYADQPDLSGQLRNILKRYAAKDKLSEAQALCQAAVTTYPDNGKMIWLESGLVQIMLDQSMQEEAESEFRQLLVKHAANSELVDVVKDLAGYSSKSRDFGMMLRFYGQFLSACASNPRAIEIEADRIGTYLRMQAIDQANTSMDAFVTKYQGHSDLAVYINRLAYWCSQRHWNCIKK